MFTGKFKKKAGIVHSYSFQTTRSAVSDESNVYSTKQKNLMLQTHILHMLAGVGFAGLFGIFIGITQGINPGFGAQLIALFVIIICIIATAQEVRNFYGKNKGFCNAFGTGFAFMCAAIGSMLVTADLSHQLSPHVKFLPASFFIIATLIFSKLAYQAQPSTSVLPKGIGITDNSLPMILQCIGAIGLCYGALEANYVLVPNLLSANVLTVFASVGCLGAVLASLLAFNNITKKPDLPDLSYDTVKTDDSPLNITNSKSTIG